MHVPCAAHHWDIEILWKALSQKPFPLKQSIQCVRHSFWLWKVCVLIWFMCILCTLDTFDGCITKILSIFCPIQNELTFEIYVENARFSATFDLNLIQHTHTHTTPFWLITKLFRWKSTFMGTKRQNINYFSCYDIYNEFHLSILPHTRIEINGPLCPWKQAYTQKGFYPLFLCNVEP